MLGKSRAAKFISLAVVVLAQEMVAQQALVELVADQMEMVRVRLPQMYCQTAAVAAVGQEPRLEVVGDWLLVARAVLLE